LLSHGRDIASNAEEYSSTLIRAKPKFIPYSSADHADGGKIIHKKLAQLFFDPVTEHEKYRRWRSASKLRIIALYAITTNYEAG